MKDDFKEILRIRGSNLDGKRRLAHGLSGISGIGRRFARAIISVLKLDPDVRTGFLSEGQIEKIEEVIKDPLAHGIPRWMLNRIKDFRTGKDIHVTSSDLAFITKLDIDRMRRIKSWKGIRHSLGLKVRGQRTRTTGRSGLVVGVSRKKKKEERLKLI